MSSERSSAGLNSFTRARPGMNREMPVGVGLGRFMRPPCAYYALLRRREALFLLCVDHVHDSSDVGGAILCGQPLQKLWGQRMPRLSPSGPLSEAAIPTATAFAVPT